MRWRGRVARGLTTAVGALALTAVVATGASAQAGLWRVVQASDGSLYLLTGGLRFALQPDPISDDELANIPDGGLIVNPASGTERSTSEPTVVPTPSATATPEGAAGPTVGTRANPVPLGTAGALAGGWRLVVQSVDPKGTDTIRAQSPARAGPTAGFGYFLARIQATNGGSAAASFQASSRLRAVGPSSVPYLTFVSSCGAIPDPLPEAAVGPGGSVTGNVCWTVRTSDAAALVLYDVPPVQGSDPVRLYFALHP